MSSGETVIRKLKKQMLEIGIYGKYTKKKGIMPEVLIKI